MIDVMLRTVIEGRKNQGNKYLICVTLDPLNSSSSINYNHTEKDSDRTS